MGRRPIVKFRPDLERFEEKQLLSAGATAAHTPAAASGAAADVAGRAAPGSNPFAPIGYLAYRITNPQVHPVKLLPPFQQVLVQKAQPVPGQTYNILYVVVRNGTAHTFTASDGLTVRVPGFTGTKRVTGNAFPVLTGNQVWKPNTWMVFYIVSKKYYPMSPQAAAGFQIQAGGRSSTIIPGPSGIITHIKYNPATFANTLNIQVAFGHGNQGGLGSKFGMPNTAINVLVNAKSSRMDYAGHF